MRRTNADLEPGGAPPGPSLEFEQLYQQLWRPMLRLAVGLVDEVPLAEEVVQDSFTALFEHWGDIRDRAAAAGYLRTTVLNRSRSVLRRRRTSRKHLALVRDEHEPGADDASLLSAEHAIVRDALVELPERQREVLSLRYLADVSDAQIAAMTGLSLPGVRSSASRGLAALRATLGGRL